MGLDINILSVPRTVATAKADAHIGSRYDANPKWEQVYYARGDWDLHLVLSDLYSKHGGSSETFCNRTVRLYKRDLPLLPPSLATAVAEHISKRRVVYAQADF
jgi:hypothetical protein